MNIVEGVILRYIELCSIINFYKELQKSHIPPIITEYKRVFTKSLQYWYSNQCCGYSEPFHIPMSLNEKVF
jgi:hypothetical protein